MEGLQDTYLTIGDAYSVISPVGSKARQSQAEDGSDDEDGSEDRSNKRDSKSRSAKGKNWKDSRDSRDSRDHRDYRDKRDHHDRPRREDIGFFCGKFNAGQRCEAKNCKRKHKCSRYVDGAFCGDNHPAYEHS